MNPKRYRAIPGSVAVGLGVALMLTGCAGTGTNAEFLVPPGKTMSAYPTDTPSPVATSAPLPYKMQDGTTVMIDRYAPLPEAVKQDLEATLAPVMAENKVVLGGTGESYDAMLAAGREVGKSLVVVQQVFGNTRGGETPQLLWAVSSPANCDPSTSKDEAVACAEAFINGDDTRYTLLVFN